MLQMLQERSSLWLAVVSLSVVAAMTYIWVLYRVLQRRAYAGADGTWIEVIRKVAPVAVTVVASMCVIRPIMNGDSGRT